MRFGIIHGAAGLAAVALFGSFTTSPVHAALIASDDASQVAYADGWQVGDDGGSGWGGGWSFRSNTNAAITATNGNRGWFVSSSLNNNSPAGSDPNADGDINTTGNRAWGLYSNTANTNEIYAVRPFSGALDVGQTIEFDF